MMQKRNISGKDLTKTITSEDILGKDVYDKDGILIGVTEKVLMDSDSLDFVGISVDKGFLKRGISIGKDYIERVTENALFLTIRLAYEIKGKAVFDNEGYKIGKIVSIELYENKNVILNIIVKSRLFFGKKWVISANNIKTIGDNVMLNIGRDKIKIE